MFVKQPHIHGVYPPLAGGNVPTTPCGTARGRTRAVASQRFNPS